VKQEDFIVAAGAGHLPGNGGLLGLLKQEGYEVTPVIAAKPSSPEKVE
jgi:uncharacterized protein YbaP (TraB family)